MSDLEKYNNAFISSFGKLPCIFSELERRNIPEWDSVGHMQLITALEDTFSIMIDTEDILDFDSYETGKTILVKYGVKI